MLLHWRHSHSIGVHGLADKELVVLEVGDDLLRESRSTGLEGLDLLLAGAPSLHSLLDLLHVGCVAISLCLSQVSVFRLTLEVTEVLLLVERGLVQTERVDNVNDLLGRVIGTLVTAILSRGVGTNVYTAVRLPSLEIRLQAYQCCRHQR